MSIVPAPATAPSPRGGPRTAEGKARSAGNALRHGLRAARFTLLPHEDALAFRELVAELRRVHAPADAVELLYVDAIAVAIWRELRVDRLEAEALADIAPAEPGRTCGSDLLAPAARASLATLARYRTQAQLEHRRALRLLEEHRRLRARTPRAHAEPAAHPQERPHAPGAVEPTVDPAAAQPAGEVPQPERVELRAAAARALAERERLLAEAARLAARDEAARAAGSVARPLAAGRDPPPAQPTSARPPAKPASLSAAA